LDAEVDGRGGCETIRRALGEVLIPSADRGRIFPSLLDLSDVFAAGVTLLGVGGALTGGRGVEDDEVRGLVFGVTFTALVGGSFRG
jgi:hypothetical protein